MQHASAGKDTACGARAGPHLRLVPARPQGKRTLSLLLPGGWSHLRSSQPRGRFPKAGVEPWRNQTSRLAGNSEKGGSTPTWSRRLSQPCSHQRRGGLSDRWKKGPKLTKECCLEGLISKFQQETKSHHLVLLRRPRPSALAKHTAPQETPAPTHSGDGGKANFRLQSCGQAAWLRGKGRW